MGTIDLSISNISVAYGDTVPVRHLSLEVRQGEFLSLLGPSGCGKTSTLRTVAGFIHPSEGDIRIGERSLLGVPPNKRNIGMVYQDYALFPHMTVEENVAFGLRMRKTSTTEIAERVSRIIAALKLAQMASRYPSQLSGGQQQRVALARALVINPSVLLLDEPLAALDKQLRANMQFELRQLQRDVGITAMFVTHDQEEALSLSDRVAVMDKGRILQVDTPRAIYDNPAHRFVAEFIGTANFLRAEIQDVGSEMSSAQLEGLPGMCMVGGRHTAGPVEIMLRPEKMRFVDAKEVRGDSANMIKGRVTGAVFVGNAMRYQVAFPSGTQVRVDTPAGSRESHIGEEVSLSWNAEDARIFPREEGAK